MTILPKKKQPKDKNEADSVERPPHSPPGVPVDGRGGARHSGMPGSPGTVPPRWGSPPPVDHDRLVPPHDPGACRYDEAAVAGGLGSAVIGANKRRLRDRDRSPTSHRNYRKQRHEGSRGGACMASTSTGSHSYNRIGRPGSGILGANQMGLHMGNPVGVEEQGGYNSEDECTPRIRDPNLEEKERWFEQALKEKRGFIIKRMGEDGACLFRSVADQVYGDQEMHSVVRQLCVDYMAKNCDFFKQYVTEDFTTYLNRKRLDSCHGNHIEMQALCELYNRPIEVYQLSIDPINTFHGSYKTDYEPIRLSYHGNVHYNSVVDPRKATIGVGLGLPGFQPGLADKNLIRDALRQSEDCHIEQTMLEDKLRETDWELTQETIEEQVARESYLQWLQEQEKYNKLSHSPQSACATCSTATDSMSATAAAMSSTASWDQSLSPEPRCSRSPRSPSSLPGSSEPVLQVSTTARLPQTIPAVEPKSPSLSDDAAKMLSLEGAVGGFLQPSTSFSETTSIMNELPPQMFGFSEWDDDVDILARVIAQSQHEYLVSLKKNAVSASSSHSSTDSDRHPSTSSQSADRLASTSADRLASTSADRLASTSADWLVSTSGGPGLSSTSVTGLATTGQQCVLDDDSCSLRCATDRGKSIMPKDRRV